MGGFCWSLHSRSTWEQVNISLCQKISDKTEECASTPHLPLSSFSYCLLQVLMTLQFCLILRATCQLGQGRFYSDSVLLYIQTAIWPLFEILSIYFQNIFQ